MTVSSATAEQAEVEHESRDATAKEASATLGRSMVRPFAAGVFLLAAAATLWIVWQYLWPYGSLTVIPKTPLFAAAIGLAMVAAMALAVLICRPWRGERRALVATSVAWSMVSLVGLVFTWSVIAVSERQNGWHGTPVFDSTDVESYLVQNVPGGIDPILIPTGVLIQSLEFLNSDNVQVTGYIWQRYGPDLPRDFERGVVLPEAVKEAHDNKEVYKFTDDGVETVGWYFAAILREPFEYAEFPFDEQNLRIRLWARDFAADVVLIPDFATYQSLDPRALPGLESEFVYSGWTPEYSGFSYANQRYDASFGIGDAGEFRNLPELFFNLVLDRDFLSPFVEHFVFAIAVASLLFGLLALTTDDERLKARFQLSTAGVLGAASGLLFAVILKHNQLRAVIGEQGIGYIEVVPIILYGVLMVVVLNAILLAAPIRAKPAGRGHSLLPVLIYWPVLLGVLLAATFAVFFRA